MENSSGIIFTQIKVKLPIAAAVSSAAARLLGPRIRFSLRTWVFVSCVCCELCR
jgi:hypothetical protein